MAEGQAISIEIRGAHLLPIRKAMRTEILARKAWPHQTNDLSRRSTRKMQPNGLPAEATTAQSFYHIINEQNQHHTTSHLMHCTNTVSKELDHSSKPPRVRWME